jgi:hypothetical protein
MTSPARFSYPGIRPSCSVAPSRSLNGSLVVTVERSRLLRLRKAIVESGCKRVGIVSATPVACGTRMRMLIAMEPQSVPVVMGAIQAEMDGI